LFTASAQTLLKIASDPKHLGAEIGVIAILHTWGQNLLLHPHIHCVVPAGGLSPDHRRWVRPRYPFFLPVKVLSRVFRGKFLAGLKRLHRRKKLQCAGPAAALANSRQFTQLIRRLHRHDWVVYAKPAFGGPLQVLRYLGRYTHRVAISNHRLLTFDQEHVTFRWKDYAHGGKQGKMTLGATEFYVASFCTCCPKASSASGTSAFSPIAFGRPVWRWADNCWPPVAPQSSTLEHTTYPTVLLSGTAHAAAHR